MSSMKYKYIGTEEQLLECGFEVGNPYVYPADRFARRAINQESFIEICIDPIRKNLWGDILNTSREIWWMTNKGYGCGYGERIREHILDLIEKGLVEIV